MKGSTRSNPPGKIRHMIFITPEIIAFVSKMFTMEAGDSYITGAVNGISPLKGGDSVKVK